MRNDISKQLESLCPLSLYISIKKAFYLIVKALFVLNIFCFPSFSPCLSLLKSES